MRVQPPMFLVDNRKSQTESELRREEVAKHVASFLRKGGKIQALAMDVSAYARSGKLTQPFVINNHTLPPKQLKQNWKEHKHGKRTTGV